MSAGTRRRLEDALSAGKEIMVQDTTIDSCYASVESIISSVKVSLVKDVEFKDVMGVYSLSFSHNTSFLAAGCGSGALQIYSCESEKRRLPLRHGSLYGLPITATKFFPFKDDQLITAGTDGTLTCWDLQTWGSFKTVDESHNEISALDFSHDGKMFGTAGKDRKIRLYDASTLQLQFIFGGTDHLDSLSEEDLLAPEAGHGRKVFALKFHPFDDNIFLTGGWDRCVKVWDVRANQVVRSIYGPYICGDAIDIYEDTVLTASWVAHDALQMWDFGSGRLVEVIPFPCADHGEYLYVGRFCSSDVVAAGGSGTNDLKIINRKNHEVIANVVDEHKPIQALDISRDSHMLATGSTGNRVQLVTLS